MRLVIAAVALACAAAAAAAQAPRTKLPGTSESDPINAVQGLVTRLLGDAKYAGMITWQVIPADPTTGNDVFELDFAAGKPVIRGNSGVALASGFHWYLKYTLNASIAWGRNGTGNQVATAQAYSAFPAPTGGASRTVSSVKYRYAYNVCTFGYSLNWYNASDWQAEIDRLAMWGVNTPLAFFVGGQELVTRQMYTALGLTDAEVDQFISGPSFLPWNRMGNMQGWGGPTPPEFWQRTAALEVQLLAMMRAYGMTPVLPGFAGHVPSALQRIFPNANYTQSADWANFPAPYGSVTFLEPADPLYVTLGAEFNKRILALFGDPTGQQIPIFNSDQYNEMEPNNSTAAYLAASNNATYAAMLAADPRSLYMMQGWLFYFQSSFWTPSRILAYLSGVPHGKLIVLDLCTSVQAVWPLIGNTPFIWNFLGIFGGRRGIYGQLDLLATQPYKDLTASNGTMVGLGITPEAIDQSFVQFDVFFEAGWRSAAIPSTSAWLSAYAVRRYGGESALIDQAYGILHTSNFNSDIDTAIGETFPGIGMRMSQNTNATGLLNALRLLVQAAQQQQVPSGPVAGNIPTTFSYDLTDIHRQFLWNLHSDINGLLSGRFLHARSRGSLQGEHDEMVVLTNLLLQTMADVDTACAADPNFLLGFWTESARAWANASLAGEEQLLLFNALNQITLWGPNGEISDYAAKNGWSGLVKEFYLGRWSIYAQAIVNSTITGIPPDWSGAVSQAINAFMYQWQNTSVSKVYPTVASGDAPVDLAAKTLSTYANAAALDGYTLLTDTDAVTPPMPPPTWVPFGSGKVAVGYDCPFLTDGDTTDIAACQASCIANSQCNEINAEASGTGNGLNACILRFCSDPFSPQLTPYPQAWSSYGLNRSATYDIFQAWHNDPAVLATLCTASAGCHGFNSNGWLKLNTTVTVASPGTSLWVKKAPPACPPLRGQHVESATGNCEPPALTLPPGASHVLS